MRWVRPVLFATSIVLATGVASAGEDTKPTPAPVPAGTLPWMGVTMDNGGDTGVKVEHVVRGSPAERAGIRSGDRIVVIDGNRVTAPLHVTRTVASHKVGDSVAVGLERTGNQVKASVVLGARPSTDDILRMDLVGAPAPAWTNVTALSGAPASVDKLKGKVALVDFWASWCGPCKLLAPKLSALKDKFGAQGLTVIGITTDDAEKAAVFAEKHQMKYGIVVDKDGDTNRTYGISAMPTMVLIDKKGVVREVFVGFDPTADARIESAIKKLLAESGPPPAAAVPAPAVPRPER